MNNRLRRLLLAGCVLVLGLGVVSSGLSCSSAGTDFDTTHVRDIVRGTTTKNDIRRWFGDPPQTDQSPNGEVWTYTYVGQHETALGVLGHETIGVNETASTRKTLIIIFDGEVVKDYEFDSGSHTDSYHELG